MQDQFLPLDQVPVELRKKFYDALARGWVRLQRFPDGYRIEPEALKQGLADAARNPGEVFVTHEQAHEIVRTEYKVNERVRTAHSFQDQATLVHLGDLWLEVLRLST